MKKDNFPFLASLFAIAAVIILSACAQNLPPQGQGTEIPCPENPPQACTREYMPVCGKIVLNMGDTVFQTYGNKCEACAAMKVVSYTGDACPAMMLNKSYKSVDPDTCARIRYVCLEGQQAFSDETGCGCEPLAAQSNQTQEPAPLDNQTRPAFVECTDPRPEICTMEYNPVCASRDNGIRCIKAPCPSTENATYATGCTACSDPKVYGYWPGGPCEGSAEDKAVVPLG